MPVSALHPAASWFLYALSLVVGAVVCLPLLFAPLRWARAIGWRIPDDTDLVVYFGRCLGGVVLGVVYIAVRAAPRPEASPVLFSLIALVSGIVAVVHLVGALERRQPWIETVETAFYAGIAAAAWGFGHGLCNESCL